MKDRPYIELAQLDVIIRDLNRNRKFRVRRGGAQIFIWRTPSEHGPQIHYQILLKRGVNVYGWKGKVREVIEAVNDALAKRTAIHSKIHPPEIHVPAAVMAPAIPDQWLPYKD